MSKTPKAFILPKLPRNLRFPKVAGAGPVGMSSATASPLKPRQAPKLRAAKTIKAPQPRKHSVKKVPALAKQTYFKKPTFI